MIPLLTSIQNNRKTGIASKIVLQTLAFSLLFTSLIVYEIIASSSNITLTIANWFWILHIKEVISISFDNLSLILLIPVNFITFLVLFYSYSYLAGSPHIIRFMSLISLFCFAMLILVLSNNISFLFIGWELVGVVSYLLVNYWFTSMNSNFSALKALLVNRVGDIFILLGIVLILNAITTTNYSLIFSIMPYMNTNILLAFNVLMIIGGCAKSGQIFLHNWLPAAMAAPTSTSALLHSSTMVTAGVFLLSRLTPVLEYSNTSLMIIVWIGSLTALLGALSGLVGFDLKRIIAYSTTSQLGYMMTAVGTSNSHIAIYHLSNHAYFKSLLFLAAGAVIHSVIENQDIRRYGSLVLYLPYTYITILIGNLSLMALPFLTGFYSKDYLILELLSAKNISHSFAFICLYLAAFLTASYSLRAMILTFFNMPNISFKTMMLLNANTRSSLIIPFVLAILTIFSIFQGYLTSGYFLNQTWFSGSLFILPSHLTQLNAEFTEYHLIPAITYICLLTIIPIRLSSGRSLSIIGYFNILHNYNNMMVSLINRFLYISVIIYRYIDKGFLSLVGSTGIWRLVEYSSYRIALLTTGYLPDLVCAFLGLFLSLLIII